MSNIKKTRRTTRIVPVPDRVPVTAPVPSPQKVPVPA